MPSSRRAAYLVVASGLLAEARIASGRDVRPIAGGGNAARLASEIDRAIADGADGILSFGMAGGLEPGLVPGTIVVPGAIVSDDARFDADEAWSARLRAALPGSVESAVAGVDAPVTTVSGKQALRRATGAAAVDMESHVAARAAARSGLPFVVLRVIADPAERAVPAAAVAGMSDDGRPDVGAVLRSLVRDPGQLRALVRLAADARRALAVLTRCRRALGPDFGFASRGLA